MENQVGPLSSHASHMDRGVTSVEYIQGGILSEYTIHVTNMSYEYDLFNYRHNFIVNTLFATHILSNIINYIFNLIVVI